MQGKPTTSRRLALALAAGALALSGQAAVLGQDKLPQNPIEIGSVEWGRDFEGALAASKRSGKPVFAFFQEVPGCSGCKTFGSVVMSDPAIVQAVQDEFIPVLIYNNRPGKDAELLKRYGEPSWNYQVMRFLDASGTDLIPRQDRIWTIEGLAGRMIRSLEIVGRRVPGYLKVVAYENEAERHATAAFAQHCFWTGELELGQIPGVITTEAGGQGLSTDRARAGSRARQWEHPRWTPGRLLQTSRGLGSETADRQLGVRPNEPVAHATDEGQCVRPGCRRAGPRLADDRAT